MSGILNACCKTEGNPSIKEQCIDTSSADIHECKMQQLLYRRELKDLSELLMNNGKKFLNLLLNKVCFLYAFRKNVPIVSHVD